MNIFNSLGSNYNLKIVIDTLFANNKKENKSKLISFLEKKYLPADRRGKTEVHLFYKGREALEAGLKILDFPKDSFVAINGFTCLVVRDAVKKANLKVLYLDIDSETLNFSPETLEIEIKKNPKIKAVVTQNTLGITSDIKKIHEICKKNKLILIEDLAHSVGGRYGDLVTLSFSQDKIIDSVSGGALIIKNKKFQNKVVKGSFAGTFETKDVGIIQQTKDRLYPLLTYIIRTTYQIGFGKVFHKVLKKTNLLSVPIDKKNIGLRDLPNWYCKIALNYIVNLDSDIGHRKKIVKIYKNNIDKKILLNTNNLTNTKPVIRFPIVVKNRNKLIKKLKSNGVYVSDIWYDEPVASKKQCSVSVKVSGQILNLPTHKNISERCAKKICVITNKWINIQ